MNLRSLLKANFGFFLVTTLTVLSICGGTAYVIERLRATAVHQALNDSAIHARAFEDLVTRSFGTVEDLADFINVGPADQTVDGIRDFFLKTLQHAPFLRSLSVVGGDGRIITSSNPANLGLKISAADYLPPLTGKSRSLYVGRPWAGRDFNDGRPSSEKLPVEPGAVNFIPVQLRIEVDGQWLTLLAAFNPDFFINYFTERLTPEEGYVDLLRQDLVVLLSTGELSQPGKNYGGQQVRALLPDKTAGRFEEVSGDGTVAFTAVRAMRQYPLLVVTHLRHDLALSDWRNESRRLVLLVVPTLLGILLLSILLYRGQQLATAQRQEKRQQERDRLAATVLDTVSEAVLVTDPVNRIVVVNPAFTQITGYPSEEAVGLYPAQLFGEDRTVDLDREIGQALEENGHWVGEVRNRRKNGELFVAWQSINLVRNEIGDVTHQVTGFFDITKYRAEADRIAWLAHHDPLTSLPNRTLFLDRLRQAIRQAHRNSGLLALIFLDLDKFKAVNDTLGHIVGDHLLQAAGERLLGCVRDSDTVVRLGGDEFVVLLPTIDAPRDADAVAEKICQAIGRPFHLNPHTIEVSSSCGIAIYPEHGTEEKQLMKSADVAMYRAKVEGGGRVHMYQAESGAS